VLDQVRQAAVARDAATLGTFLAPGFRGQGQDREAVLVEVRRLFALYASVGVEFADVTREAKANGVYAVALRAVFSGRPRQVGSLADLLPTAAVYAFELEFEERADGSVLLRSAQWRAETP